MSYIGNCTYKCTVQSFLSLNKEAWLTQMQKNYSRVTSHRLLDSMVRSWSNCFAVLQTTFAALPDEYQKLQIIFEYVMPLVPPGEMPEPAYNGVRPDVLLLSKDTIIVLEFKDYLPPQQDALKKILRQPRKYTRRLRHWHTGSVGMRRMAVLVFTAGKNIQQHEYRVDVCSPDRLPEVLRDLFPAPISKLSKGKRNKWMSAKWRVMADI